MNDTITFTCEREGGPTVTFELSADADADELVTAFKEFMLALSYSPETVNEYFPEAV